MSVWQATSAAGAFVAGFVVGIFVAVRVLRVMAGELRRLYEQSDDEP